MMAGAEQLLVDLPVLGRAINDLLAAHHGLRASLKDPLPWDTRMADAMKHYGMGGPLFHLWNECRLVEALRVAWTGEPSKTE